MLNEHWSLTHCHGQNIFGYDIFNSQYWTDRSTIWLFKRYSSTQRHWRIELCLPHLKKTCSYYISYAILNSISHLSPLWPPTRKWPSKPTSIKSSGTNQRVCPTYTLNSIQCLQSKQYILTNAEYLLLYHLILLLSSLWTQAHRANHNAGVIISCYLNRPKTILHSPTLSTYCCTMLLSSLWTWALRAHHTDEDIILNRPKLNSTTHQRWVLLSPTQ